MLRTIPPNAKISRYTARQEILHLEFHRRPAQVDNSSTLVVFQRRLPFSTPQRLQLSQAFFALQHSQSIKKVQLLQFREVPQLLEFRDTKKIKVQQPFKIRRTLLRHYQQ